MSTKPISNYLAAALLMLGAAFAGANWYLQPQRTIFWAGVMIVIVCMAIILVLASRRTPNATASDTADSIRRGIVFAGLMLVIPLGLKLGTALGAIDHADLSRRALMAIIGAFLMSTGNAIPKTLTPLAALRCDARRAQAFHRFAGWTWVLTGLALAIAWLALPLGLADSMTFVVVPAGIGVIAVGFVRCRSGQRSGGVTELT